MKHYNPTKPIAMTLKHSCILLLFSFVILACKNPDPNKQIDEGKIENNIYVSQEVGWRMEIPEGWDIVTLEETNASNEVGFDVIEDMVDGEIDLSEFKNLLSFKKNQFNLFSSSSERFIETYENEWEENNIALKELISDAYTGQGIKSTSTDITTETIDGIKFSVYEFSIYGPDNNIILNQLAYSALINGYDFAANINYNNEDDKNEMLNAFKNSTFKKPKSKG
ncbi:hypothetical protein [Psychroserpens algicola]|uniref:Lipoprotein n=1 Tax=Psychroserpens algicola TaxID=1719034 RepID=A0ABT0HAV5_9FLAO|nr:hypothetical protein [Psychroserpens algicola]MCK8481472.1 hypothetical protein [Psychroserpens algicola]